jgi:hypothetical protein
VNTTRDSDVRFSADAQFHSQWTDLALEGGAATEGGVGVIVYEGGNTVAREDAVLWSDSQVGVWQSATDEESTFLTQTAAGQTYFHMVPGRQYQVWVWCWTTAAVLGNALALASIKAEMPFVVVEEL